MQRETIVNKFKVSFIKELAQKKKCLKSSLFVEICTDSVKSYTRDTVVVLNFHNTIMQKNEINFLMMLIAIQKPYKLGNHINLEHNSKLYSKPTL